ncbi:MAG TPA: hypothetical protein VGU22_02240 [Methylomirabilota bacterium]|jgi:hypothetical protein|nr:hypothetical protein [Methylomirabilota bacterium]
MRVSIIRVSSVRSSPAVSKRPSSRRLPPGALARATAVGHGQRRLRVLRQALDRGELVGGELGVHLPELAEREDRETVDPAPVRLRQTQQRTGARRIPEGQRRRGLGERAHDGVEVHQELLVVGIVERVGRPVAESPARGGVPDGFGQCLQGVPPEADVVPLVAEEIGELGRADPAKPAADRAPLAQLDGERRVDELAGAAGADLVAAARDLPVTPGGHPCVAGSSLGERPVAKRQLRGNQPTVLGDDGWRRVGRRSGELAIPQVAKVSRVAPDPGVRGRIQRRGLHAIDEGRIGDAPLQETLDLGQERPAPCQHFTKPVLSTLRHRSRLGGDDGDLEI